MRMLGTRPTDSMNHIDGDLLKLGFERLGKVSMLSVPNVLLREGEHPRA